MSDRTEQFVVERSQPGVRLDRYLADRYPTVSRGSLQRLIDEGHITVNSQPTKSTHTPRAGDCIAVTWPAPRAAEAQAEDIPIDVLFEDKDLLVINKAPGIVVHPSAGHEEHTLVNALLHHCEGQLSGVGGVARPGIVHRLDKDTSGCLVVAKNDETHLALSEQFAGRTTEKKYRTILCGELPRETGKIDAAIARHPSHRKRMAVTEGDGREALTSYQVLDRLLGATLVEAMLHTGRTHQLRVHFQHIGFPIVGDDVYGLKATSRLSDLTGYTPPRVLLHSFKLAFVHPRTGRRRVFTAPQPADFAAAIKALQPPT